MKHIYNYIKMLGSIKDKVYYTPEYRKVEKNIDKTWTYIVRCYNKDSELISINDVIDENNNYFIYTKTYVKMFIHTLNHKTNKVSELLSKHYVTGLNIGKKNETTPVTQAIKDADNKISSRTRYRGSFKPMLASIQPKDKTYDLTDAYVQYKLDGVRMLVHMANGKVKLMHSRGGKETTGLSPVIAEELESLNIQDCILDGELYTHGHNLNKINGRANRHNYVKGSIIDNYNIFDAYYDDEASFETRLGRMNFSETEHIKKVKAIKINTREELDKLEEQAHKEKYEGLIVRVSPCIYEPNTRSNHLLKIKKKHEDLFELVSYTAGTTGLHVDAIILICVTAKGKEFRVTVSDTLEKRKKAYRLFEENKELFKKEKILVKYMDVSTHGIPLQTTCDMPEYISELIK